VVVLSLGAIALVSVGVAISFDASGAGAILVDTGSPGWYQTGIGDTGGVVTCGGVVSARASASA
jgi:hypothetical protein